MSENVDGPRLQEVIICQLERRGGGHSIIDPIRRISQVYDLDGNLLFEHDPYNSFSFDQLVDFAQLYREEKERNVESVLSSWFQKCHPA